MQYFRFTFFLYLTPRGRHTCIVFSKGCPSLHTYIPLYVRLSVGISYSLFWSGTLKEVDGYQPYNTGVIFGGPRCAFRGNCSLAHFWYRTKHHNYLYICTFVPQSISLKQGGKQPNLTGGSCP